MCPLSSTINVKEDGYLGYPYEIFATNSWNIDINGDNVYKCKGIDSSLNGARDPSEIRNTTNWYHCLDTSKDHCPMKVRNIQSALSVIKWKLRPQICQVYESLLNHNETVKIVILGGSLPQGIDTYGCCCKFDSKCPNENILNEDCPRSRDDLNSGCCSWPNYLYRYLKKVFPANVELINLSRGGQTSVLTLLQWDELMGNIKLTMKDIVLLDYSVNDEVSYGNRPSEIEFALEGIVRKLLVDGPAIFILEMYPRPPIRYTIPCRKIAAHYKLPIISYYENVYSDFLNRSSPIFDSNEVNPILYEHLMFDHSISDMRHPAFYIHIYYAELIAVSILVLSRHCVHMKTPKQLIHPIYESAINLHDKNISSSIDVLHASMQGTYFCLANSHVDFHIDACQEMMHKINDSGHDTNTMMMIHSQCHHINISAISTDTYSLHGFKLVIENKGKPGFIYEINSNMSNMTNTDLKNDITIPLHGGLLQGDGKVKKKYLF